MKILRKLHIREIASVDRPAQIGASVVILKRNTPQPSGEKPVNESTQPTVEQLAKQLADSQAELAVQKSLASLSDSEKSHYSSLSDAAKTEFLKLDANGRKVELAKVGDSNPVVFKSAEGVEFRKNDDSRLVEMAKRLDAETAIRKANDEKIARTSLEKRATDSLPNLPGKMDSKVALLKAIDGISDQASRDEVVALLAAGNTAMASALKKVGTTATPVDGDAKSQLETLTKARMIEKKSDYFTAYSEVSAENPALAEQAITAKA